MKYSSHPSLLVIVPVAGMVILVFATIAVSQGYAQNAPPPADIVRTVPGIGMTTGMNPLGTSSSRPLSVGGMDMYDRYPHGDGGGTAKLLPDGNLEVRDCLVKFDRQITLSANVSAQLTELKTQLLHETGSVVADTQGHPVIVEVRPGLAIKKGQILGQQDNEIQKKAIEIAEKEVELANNSVAETEIAIQYAEQSAKVALVEVDKNKAINKRQPGSVPELEILKLELQYQQAFLGLEKTKQELQSKKAEVEVKKAQLSASQTQMNQRRIIAPLDAEIADVLRNEGEWCREGDPILRLIRLDVLRITSKSIDAKKFTPEMLRGKPVTVETRMVDGTKRQLRGTVVFVNREVTIGDVFEIRVDVQNQTENGDWILRPGTNVDMLIHLVR